MQFTKVCDRVIKLAHVREQENEEQLRRLARKHGREHPAAFSLSELWELRDESCPAETELRKYLESLTESHLVGLQVVMYVGRGDGDHVTLAHHLDSCMPPGVSRFQAALICVMEKAPLGRYLENGLKELRASGIDPNDEWQ